MTSRSELITHTVVTWLRRHGAFRSFEDVHNRCAAVMQREMPDEYPPVSDVEVKAAIQSSPDWQLMLAGE